MSGQVTVTCAECLRSFPLPESKVSEIRQQGIDPLDANNPFVSCAVRALQAAETNDGDLFDLILVSRAAEAAKRALGVASSREWLERTRARRAEGSDGGTL